MSGPHICHHCGRPTKKERLLIPDGERPIDKILAKARGRIGRIVAARESGLTFRELGVQFGISAGRASQIVRRAQSRANRLYVPRETFLLTADCK